MTEDVSTPSEPAAHEGGQASPHETARPLSLTPTPLRMRYCLFPALLAGLALIGLRTCQLLSHAHQLFDGELMELGALAWDPTYLLDLWNGERFDADQFFQASVYMSYAPGTAYTRLTTALLHLATGGEAWAQWATGIFAEATCVFLCTWALLRCRAGLWVPIALGALLFQPWFITSWQLLPFGNHTEWLVVPTAMAGWLAAKDTKKRGILGWTLLGLLALIGPLAYRLNAGASAAIVATALFASVGRWKRLYSLLVIGGALGAAAGLHYSVSIGGQRTLAPEMRPLSWASLDDRAIEALALMPQAIGPQLPWTSAPWLSFGVAGGAALAWPLFGWAKTASGRVARFASLWFILSPLPILLLEQVKPRYLISSWYALIWCGIALLLPGAPRVLRLASVLTLGLWIALGLQLVPQTLHPDLWARNATIRGLGLWHQLGVESIDRDEIPYYNKMLDEGRGGPGVGWASATSAASCKKATTRALRWAPFEPRADHCQGFSRGEATQWLRNALEINSGELRTQLVDVGRGIWIRCQREPMQALSSIIGLEEEYAVPIRYGILDEASRWGLAEAPPPWTAFPPRSRED